MNQSAIAGGQFANSITAPAIQLQRAAINANKPYDLKDKAFLSPENVLHFLGEMACQLSEENRSEKGKREDDDSASRSPANEPVVPDPIMCSKPIDDQDMDKVYP